MEWKMKTRGDGRVIRMALVLAGLATAGLVACDGEDTPTEPAIESSLVDVPLADAELGGAIEQLTGAIELTDEQRTAIADLAARHRGSTGEPGTAWYAAAELQGILTSEQIAEIESTLAEMNDRIRGQRGERSAMRGRYGDGSHDGSGFEGMHGRMGDFGGLELTEEQQDQVQAVHESHAAERQALREEFQAGDLTREEMRTRVDELRDAIRAEIEPLLTQEQRDLLQQRESRFEERRGTAGEHWEAARQRGEAQHAAMVDALGLTDEQIEVLDALREGRSGSFGRAGDESRTEIREAHRAALEGILTDEQLEIVTLHRALMAHRFQAAAREGRRRGHGEHTAHPGGHGGHRGFTGT